MQNDSRPFLAVTHGHLDLLGFLYDQPQKPFSIRRGGSLGLGILQGFSDTTFCRWQHLSQHHSSKTHAPLACMFHCESHIYVYFYVHFLNAIRGICLYSGASSEHLEFIEQVPSCLRSCSITSTGPRPFWQQLGHLSLHRGILEEGTVGGGSPAPRMLTLPTPVHSLASKILAARPICCRKNTGRPYWGAWPAQRKDLEILMGGSPFNSSPP